MPVSCESPSHIFNLNLTLLVTDVAGVITFTLDLILPITDEEPTENRPRKLIQWHGIDPVPNRYSTIKERDRSGRSRRSTVLTEIEDSRVDSG